MTRVVLGSDPELFLIKEGKFISAVGKCGGTKEKPFEFQKGFSVHNDNVAVEFNVPPASTVEDWVQNHHTALKYCRDMAKKYDCSLKIVSDAVFTKDQLESKEAQEFGCNPDYNAWNLRENEAPSAATDLRTAGGHIHIGAELSFREKIQVVRLLDVFLGIPLKLLEPGSRRNELYGKPGCMREKPYGVEYRTPSNYWLKSTAMMMDVFRTVKMVVERRDDLQEVLERMQADTLNDASGLKNVVHETLHKHTEFYAKGIHAHVF